MRDRVQHAERHDAAAGRRVGGDEQAIERAWRSRQSAQQKSGAQIAGRAELQRHVALIDQAREVGVRHGDRAAVDVKRHVRPHGEQMVGRDRATSRGSTIRRYGRS